METIINAPLLRGASTTTTASESPLIILFLLGKSYLRQIYPGGFSEIISPFLDISLYRP